MAKKKLSKTTISTIAHKKAVLANIASGHNLTVSAKMAGMERTVIYSWIRKDKKFAEDFDKAQKSKEKIELEMVKSALVRRATGYTYEEIHTESYGRKVVVKKILKTVPPDTGAIVFYLCNKDSENFQNTQHIRHSDRDGDPLSVMLIDAKDQYRLKPDKGKKK